jgi:uncharacterized hydrophobic protein (TIGR00271 family)
MISRIRNYFSVSNDLDSYKNISETINQGITFRGTNLLVLVFAIFIASLGLNINSTAVVIGAMLISPLMGPIIGTGFGAATYNVLLIKRALKNYFFATITSLFTSTLYFLISPIGDAHAELLARTAPNIYDVLIALFGGFAGITAITSKFKGNILPGVAISTALMPPLCTAGYGIATFQIPYFMGALYLYFINTVFIILSAYLYLKFIHYPREEKSTSDSTLKANRIIFWVSIITIIPSIYLGYGLVTENNFNRNANKYINAEFNFNNTLVVKKAITPSQYKIEIFLAGAKVDSVYLRGLILKKDMYNLSNATVEINQGATFEKKGIADNFNEDILLEKTNIILINMLDSLSRKKDYPEDFYKELKFVDSNIDTGYIINHTAFAKDQSNQVVTVFLENKHSQSKSINLLKVTNWLKLRLHKDSVVVKIVR